MRRVAYRGDVAVEHFLGMVSVAAFGAVLVAA
jgi:hypothetical protein